VWVEDAAALAEHPDAISEPVEAVRAGRVRVAVDDRGVIVGFLVVVIAAADSWELDDLFVEPTLMRRGIGRDLVADLWQRAKAAGIRKVQVTANSNAVGFYERMGFVDIGEVVATRFRPATRMERNV